MARISVTVIATLACMVIGSSWGQTPTLEMQITQEKASPGDTLTMTCRVANKGTHIVSFGKSFWIDGVLKHEVIANDLALLNPYSSNNRYMSMEKVTISKNVELYKLTVSNVEPQDSGNITCYLLGNATIRDTKVLYVYQNIQELSLNGRTVNETVNISLTEDTEILCEAKGSIPAANIQIFLDDKNITSDFTKMTTEIVQCNQGRATDKTCFLHSTFTQTAVNALFRPTYKDNKKNLTCKGFVEHSRLPRKEVSMHLMMTFPPKLECESIHQVKLYEDAHIRCLIYASPSLDNFSWSFRWGGKNITLANNEQTTEGEIRAGQEIETDRVEIFLHIKNVSNRHLMRFNLTVSNSVGSQSLPISLQKDPRYRISEPPAESEGNNTASFVHVTGTLMVVTAAAHWLL